MAKNSGRGARETAAAHISETNMAIRFTKKCMERKNIIEDRIISGVPVTFPKLESVRRNNRDPMLWMSNLHQTVNTVLF